jgi:hypothetical protein
MTLFPAILLLALTVPRPAAPHMQEIDIWYVEKWDGDVGQYELIRGHEYPDLVLIEQLHPLDVLKVKTSSGKIYLVHESRNQSKETVICASKGNGDCSESSPFTIPGDAGLEAALGASWLGGWLTRQRKDQIHPEEARVERGGTIRVPLLKSGPFGTGRIKILPGKRDFVLAWQGCTPPYSLRVFDISKVSQDISRDVISIKGWKDQFLRVPNVDLEASKYEVEIRCTDYTVAIFRAQFDVVRTSSPPDAPAQLLEGTPQNLIPLITTAWISCVNDGVWEFEAYLRLMNQSSRSANEETFAKAMELGERLEPPPDLK